MLTLRPWFSRNAKLSFVAAFDRNKVSRWVAFCVAPVTLALQFMLAVACLTVAVEPAQVAGQSAPSRPEQKQSQFDDRTASRLLLQLTQGMENGTRKQVLGAFDFSQMNDGQLFQQQLISFLSHAESIRIHLNLVNTASDGAKGSAEADLEMEVEPRDGTLPVHKQSRVKFSVENTNAGWKIVDIQPRQFFSREAE